MLFAAALWTGCGDSEEPEVVGGGRTDGGSETQQPVSPDEILPRRIVSADLTVVGDYTCTMLFDYDEQGRLVLLTETDFRDVVHGYYPETEIQRFVYDGDTITSKNETYEYSTVYRLENGRVVSFRYEELRMAFWWETSFVYDAAGYLVSMSDWNAEDERRSYLISYESNGFSLEEHYSEGRTTYTVEYDRSRLNNLNLDLYGWDEIVEVLVELWADAPLLGIAGERLRYLPAKMTSVNTFEEDGRWCTETSVTSFAYKTDGEYLSEVEVYYNDELSIRLVLHYE